MFVRVCACARARLCAFVCAGDCDCDCVVYFVVLAIASVVVFVLVIVFACCVCVCFTLFFLCLFSVFCDPGCMFVFEFPHVCDSVILSLSVLRACFVQRPRV